MGWRSKRRPIQDKRLLNLCLICPESKRVYGRKIKTSGKPIQFCWVTVHPFQVPGLEPYSSLEYNNSYSWFLSPGFSLRGFPYCKATNIHDIFGSVHLSMDRYILSRLSISPHFGGSTSSTTATSSLLSLIQLSTHPAIFIHIHALPSPKSCHCHEHHVISLEVIVRCVTKARTRHWSAATSS